MVDELNPSPYSKGFWVWEIDQPCLSYISTVPKQVIQIAGGDKKDDAHAAAIIFSDTFDIWTQRYFRMHFQRKPKMSEPCVVTIQDCKDVAIFTANPKNLNTSFIDFLHTKTVDEFIRSLVIYFQYYFQLWDQLMHRREEMKRKLRHPGVFLSENIVRDNLADLRSMVTKYYTCILLGMGDVVKYYHMSPSTHTSQSEKDRFQFEALVCMLVRIVWIALNRRYLSLIELEFNRLLRTNNFNTKLRQISTFKTKKEEDRVLLGQAYQKEYKLKHRSPIVQELLFFDHDYNMLGIGEIGTPPDNKRLKFLETVYTCPENLILGQNIQVGILGCPRDNFEPFLRPKEAFTKVYFELPQIEKKDDYVPETLQTSPTMYKEPDSVKVARKTQCQLWKNYLLNRLDVEPG